MEARENKTFDPSLWIAKLLQYESYLRLMCLLFVVGLLVGLAYFVYSRAIYSSKALVQIRLFSQTADEKGALRPMPVWRVRRLLLTQFRARHFQAEVGAKLGFVREGTSWGQMRDYAFPSIRVGVLDDDFLEISVLSYFPEGVRKYSKGLLELYLEKDRVVRDQYRVEAVKRYSKELEDVRKRLDVKMTAKLDFEEDYKLAEAYINLDSLNDIPVAIVQTKDRIAKMDQVRKDFLKNKERLDVLGKLSLLTRFEQLEPLIVGKLIRRSRGDKSVPIKLQEKYSYNSNTNLVVQPDMVDGLFPWQGLEKTKRLLEEKVSMQRNTFGEEHPIIKDLLSEIDELDGALETELQVKLKSFDLEYTQLQDKIALMESKLPEYHKMTREYDETRLDYALLDNSELAWDKAHARISQQISGLEFGENRRPAELEFKGFSELRDTNPISPNKRKLITMGLVLGFALAFGVPFVIELFNDTSASLQQLEESLGMSGIGVLPLESKQELENLTRASTLDSTTPHHLLEAFRVIRSNVILHPGPSGKTQVVMVTSACPSEGKTTHAANLAWAFSSMGEKTLLVDCELRRGRLHLIAKVDNSLGMTALLTGEISETEAAISIDGTENLWIIPRGPVRPGVTELLCQDRFRELMEGWRERYDRIVIDTPPVLGLSETVPLQRLADGVIIVVKADSTARRDLVQSVDFLRKGGAHFYGFILNQVDLAKRSNHYNYFYYSANYYGEYNRLEGDGVKLLDMKS
ncbi:MAG: polysaccharide biosynthesis tyrosine autokinase [Verrucomicrobiales bacterium]|nr:polysaccharide biosynthesis tyrosine autokinase [Verrucomicrobiales bacterium]